MRIFARRVSPFAKTVPFPSVAAPEAALCSPRLRAPLPVQIHPVWIGRFVEDLGQRPGASLPRLWCIGRQFWLEKRR